MGKEVSAIVASGGAGCGGERGRVGGGRGGVGTGAREGMRGGIRQP